MSNPCRPLALPVCFLLATAAFSGCFAAAEENTPAPAPAGPPVTEPQPALMTIGVDSPAVSFSPGNWAGDIGRGGSAFRVTWNSGAYCAFYWSTTAEKPQAMLDISDATPGARFSYFLAGALVHNVKVPAAGGVALTGLSAAGAHRLEVYTGASQQNARWSRANGFTVKGLQVDAGSTPGTAPKASPWVEIIGDSITEGIGVDSNLADYSFLVGQGLRRAGYDYCVSACGYSGWLRPGDASGDVPPYYSITASNRGTGGTNDPARSRWNKIDGATSLLDAEGHISGHGGTGQEPAAILYNYIVNEAITRSDLSDAQASVTQALSAARSAAPEAWILVLVPPGLRSTRVYPGGAAYIAALESGVQSYQQAHPGDQKLVKIDLGEDVANSLGSPAYGGGVHPNAAGQAFLAPLVLQSVLQCVQAPAAVVSIPANSKVDGKRR